MQESGPRSSARPAEGSIDGSLDLSTLLSAAFQGRWIIGLATLAFALSGIAYALLAKQWYRAEVLLIPVSQNLDAGLQGQLGGIGSLMGLVGLGPGAGDATEPLAVLSSREFSEGFIEDQHLMPLFFAEDWDARAGRWKSLDPSDAPDIRDGVKYFAENILEIDEDKKTGLVTMAVVWTDAEVAAKWANLMVERLNERMRQRALQESQANVDYLGRELGSATIVTLQQSIAHLIEAEMQKLMMAKGRKEYAFRVVDRAIAPKLRYKPKRVLVVAIATVAGAMVSVVWVLLGQAVGRRRRVHAPANGAAGA